MLIADVLQECTMPAPFERYLLAPARARARIPSERIRVTCNAKLTGLVTRLQPARSLMPTSSASRAHQFRWLFSIAVVTMKTSFGP